MQKFTHFKAAPSSTNRGTDYYSLSVSSAVNYELCGVWQKADLAGAQRSVPGLRCPRRAPFYPREGLIYFLNTAKH